eukprot:TRINITY_DN15507_c0_g1_i1.p1 TRINITY_DN15507_c0_g1~~TRINITY_DN15507_c0_g1_i1.p1  ORF type:complete len:200 (-),score=42.23 TRINITY_DN15507_c0_g1_i1:84-683(-)
MADKSAKPPTPTAPSKGNVYLRTKKNLATKAAGSKLVKKALPDEAKQLLKWLRIICERTNQPKRSEIVEKNLFKLVAKAMVLSDEKLVTLNEFLVADDSLRKSFDLLYDLYDYYGHPEKVKNARPKFERIVALLREVESILDGIFRPHLQPKSMGRIKSIFDSLADIDWIMGVYLCPDINDELFELVNALSKYTQFHYN